jgi:lysophospholipase L1-like esterase
MEKWIGTWGASPSAPVHFVPLDIMAAPAPVQGTIRHRMRVSAGGSRVRLRLSNETGDRALLIGGTSVGLAGEAAEVRLGTLLGVTFGGRSAIAIIAGAAAVSDPVDLAVVSLSELVVSVYLPQHIVASPSEGVHRAMFVSGRDAVLEEAWRDAAPLVVRPLVTAISVQPLRPTRVIVALGDSVTDGGAVDAKEGRSWTDSLASRLEARADAAAYAVVNAGIGGNRLIGQLIGPPALVRLDRDVFTTPGVTDLIVLEGINDIGVGGRTIEGVTYPMIVFDELVAAYLQIIERAHERGVKVIGGTLLPFRDAFFFSDEKERTRQSINEWIRSGGAFDGVIDFDAVVRDPGDSSALRPEFDTGDHLHPNHAAYRAMGEAVDLNLFDH